MGVADILSEHASAPAEIGAFHLSRAWFTDWDAAYLGPDQTPVEIGGLAMLDEPARLGPIAFRQRRARSNLQTPAFDIAPDTSPDPRLPQMLLDRGVDVVTIDHLEEDSPLLLAARDWRGDFDVRIEPHAVAPAADCRESYPLWLSRRSKRVRHRWPRLEAHVTQSLGMRYDCVERFDDLTGLLAEIFAVEASGWKGRDGTAIRCDPADLQFYTNLAHSAAAAGALRIATLRQGDRITAFEYGIFNRDRLYLLKVGYDERFEDASIGHVLASMHIRDCCGDPRIAWYDKLGNGMTPAAYKLRFADHLGVHRRITLYSRGWRGRAVRAADQARRHAKLVRDAWRARRAAA